MNEAEYSVPLTEYDFQMIACGFDALDAIIERREATDPTFKDGKQAKDGVAALRSKMKNLLLISKMMNGDI